MRCVAKVGGGWGGIFVCRKKGARELSQLYLLAVLSGFIPPSFGNGAKHAMRSEDL